MNGESRIIQTSDGSLGKVETESLMLFGKDFYNEKKISEFREKLRILQVKLERLIRNRRKLGLDNLQIHISFLARK